MTLFGHITLMMSHVLFASQCAYISVSYGIEMLLHISRLYISVCTQVIVHKLRINLLLSENKLCTTDEYKRTILFHSACQQHTISL